MSKQTKKAIDDWIDYRFGEGHLFNNQLLYDFYEWLLSKEYVRGN